MLPLSDGLAVQSSPVWLPPDHLSETVLRSVGLPLEVTTD